MTERHRHALAAPGTRPSGPADDAAQRTHPAGPPPPPPPTARPPRPADPTLGILVAAALLGVLALLYVYNPLMWIAGAWTCGDTGEYGPCEQTATAMQWVPVVTVLSFVLAVRRQRDHLVTLTQWVVTTVVTLAVLVPLSYGWAAVNPLAIHDPSPDTGPTWRTTTTATTIPAGAPDRWPLADAGQYRVDLVDCSDWNEPAAFGGHAVTWRVTNTSTRDRWFALSVPDAGWVSPKAVWVRAGNAEDVSLQLPRPPAVEQHEQSCARVPEVHTFG